MPLLITMNVALEIAFVNGFHGSSDPQRTRAEWPPSPDRNFQALISCFFEMKRHAGQLDEKAEAAIRWLETQPLPDILYPEGIPSKMTTWVPINSANSKGLASRSFVRVNPRHPTIYYVWPGELNEHWEWISKMLNYYTRLGSSRSAATARLILELPDHTKEYTRITPDQNGNIALSAYYPGRFDDLDAAFESNLPVKRRFTYYRPVDDIQRIHPGLFQKFRTFQLKGQALGCRASSLIACQTRRALLSIANKLGHELPCLIAHDYSANHLAYIPLIYAGSEYANGFILGVGVGIPHGVSVDERAKVEEVLDNFNHLQAEDFEFQVQDLQYTKTTYTLSPSRWSTPSDIWETVTPVEFRWSNTKPDHSLSPERRQEEFQRLRYESIRRQIVQYCEWLGLPEVVDVWTSDTPWLQGSDISKRFFSPNYHKGRQRGFLSHIRVAFKEKVRGPIIMGRGGNFGIGVFSPIQRTEGSYDIADPPLRSRVSENR